MEERPAILVVEDERAIRVGLCDVLAYRGYAPTGVEDGESGLREALSGRYALVLLDVMLPGVDGFTICRRTREALPRQAILLLTARGSEDDILEGFRAGCDDYVAKPFSLAQLLARVDALLRRAESAPIRSFSLGDVEVDGDALRARRAGASVELSRRDVEVLHCFSQAPGRVVSREDLLRQVWGYQRVEAVETRAVDMHLVKLRRKLEPLVGEEVLIETVRGAGYRVAVRPA
jgi:two-component system response regulator RegX3